MVKERFGYFFNNRETIYKFIDLEAEEISKYIAEENELWGNLCTSGSEKEEVVTAYFKKVEDLKDWLELRFRWLKSNLN